MNILSGEGSIFIFGAALLLFWLIRAVTLLRRTISDPVLSTGPVPLESSPLVTILLPVRNEERNIEECIRSFQNQTYTNWELVVIDDRSEDKTAEIVRALQKEDRRIRLVTNKESPPPEWSGQVYANVKGTKEARGEWLVYTDADTRHHPAHLNSALSYCLRNNAELLTIVPGQVCGSFWEYVMQPFVFWLFWDYYPPSSVNRKGSRRAGSSGTFFLVKREAYEAMGGWEPVHNCIPDDLAFMEMAKEKGVVAHLVVATRTLRVRMYHGLTETFEGWSRYMLSGANNNICMPAIEVFYALVFNILPFLFPFFIPRYPYSAFLLAASALLILFIRFRINRLLGVEGRWAITHPLASGLLIVVAFNTLYRRIAGKGVTWRGRVYLEEGRGIFWTGKRYKLSEVAEAESRELPESPEAAEEAAEYSEV